MATYAIRNYVRICVLKQFSAEDYLLLLAAVCLTAATGLTYAAIPYQYNSLQVILEGDFSLLSKLLSKVPQISKEENAAACLWWFVIFPVKLAYLIFFRRLIIHQRVLKMWWWFSIVFTVLAGIACLIAAWMTCPYFTTNKVLCTQVLSRTLIWLTTNFLALCTGPSTAYRSIRNVSITTVMDVLTDILVISFPPALLWKVRINMQQKVGLGLMLSLSIVMIIITSVRIGGIKGGRGEVDIVWTAFWQQQESSIALTMVCTSAFRSLYVARVTKKKRPNGIHHYFPSHWRRRLIRQRLGGESTDEERDAGLPEVPRATLTGMTSMIQGARLSTV